jgi:toxin ParE1/3/4
VTNGPLFFDQAWTDYEAALVYYETRETGLGTRFEQEMDQALSTVLEYPQAFALVDDVPTRLKLRSAMLRSFPIKMVYTVDETNTLLVVAVFHAHRHPGFWLNRLPR